MSMRGRGSGTSETGWREKEQVSFEGPAQTLSLYHLRGKTGGVSEGNRTPNLRIDCQADSALG